MAQRFIERTAPDLVVEVEITHADESKIERYAELGVRELWRLHGRADSRTLRVEFSPSPMIWFRASWPSRKPFRGSPPAMCAKPWKGYAPV